MRQLTANDFQVSGVRKKVEFEDLGGYVYIKKLTVDDSKSFQEADVTNVERGNLMVIAAIVDEQGNQIFTDTAQLKDAGLDKYQTLTNAIMDYNGLSKKAVEEIEKN